MDGNNNQSHKSKDGRKLKFRWATLFYLKWTYDANSTFLAVNFVVYLGSLGMQKVVNSPLWKLEGGKAWSASFIHKDTASKWVYLQHFMVCVFYRKHKILNEVHFVLGTLWFLLPNTDIKHKKVEQSHIIASISPKKMLHQKENFSVLVAHP